MVQASVERGRGDEVRKLRAANGRELSAGTDYVGSSITVQVSVEPLATHGGYQRSQSHPCASRCGMLRLAS